MAAAELDEVFDSGSLAPEHVVRSFHLDIHLLRFFALPFVLQCEEMCNESALKRSWHRFS